MSTVRRTLGDQRGFSLAELLVVVAILGLMLSGLLVLQMQGQQSYLMGSRRVEAQQNGRVALELMVRELRSARSVTAIPSGTDVTFIDGTGATIRYQLAGSTINRIAGGIATPLIGGVRAFTATYFRDFNGATNTGTPAGAPANVRLVRIQLETGSEESAAAYSPANQKATVESIVRLRNM